MNDDWQLWMQFQKVREAQAKLTADQRKELWHGLMEGYCPHCGYEDPKGNCSCERDE